MSRKRIWQSLGMLLAAFAGVGLSLRVLRNVDLEQVLASASQLKPLWITVALLISPLTLLLAACEWRLLVPAGRQISVRTLFGVQCVMCLLQNTAHHFAGQGYALFQLMRKQHLPAAAVLSLLALDQLAEGVARLTWILPAVGLLAWPVATKAAVGVLAIGVSSLGLSLLVFLLLERRYAAATVDEQSSWLARQLNRVAGGRHLQLLARPKILAAIFGLAISKKLVRAAAVLAVQQSLGLALPWYMPLVIVAAIDLATMVPLVPGHLGVYEAAVTLVCEWQGVPAESALALAILSHAVTLAATIVPGLILLISQGLRPLVEWRQAPTLPTQGIP